jgi:hypothetical protein
VSNTGILTLEYSEPLLPLVLEAVTSDTIVVVLIDTALDAKINSYGSARSKVFQEEKADLIRHKAFSWQASESTSTFLRLQLSFDQIYSISANG